VLAAAVLLGGCGAGARRSFQLGIVADADDGTRAGKRAALRLAAMLDQLVSYGKRIRGTKGAYTAAIRAMLRSLH
jgi:hypothetical protein